MMANEESYPENARALALNGAEVIYRASYPHPATGNEYFEIQNRARALDNNVYVVAPNMGTYHLFAEENTPIDTFGGRSSIINYRVRSSANKTALVQIAQTRFHTEVRKRSELRVSRHFFTSSV
jgi:predicted amidohydrolase